MSERSWVHCLRCKFTIRITFAFIVIGVLLVPLYFESSRYHTSMEGVFPPPAKLLNSNGNNNDATNITLTGDSGTIVSTTMTIPKNPVVYCFYYMWYNIITSGGRWEHWDHQYIDHWNEQTAAAFRQKGFVGKHNPDNHDIASRYFPQVGPYFSGDPNTVRKHVDDVEKSGIDVLGVSWWGTENGADSNGFTATDSILPILLDAAVATKVRICIHIEPYPNRSATSVLKDIIWLEERYGSHPAYFRNPSSVYFVYDSYLILSNEWSAVLMSRRNPFTNKIIDVVILGLIVEETHLNELHRGGFDGGYTYFAADGFTFGSTLSNWVKLSQEALKLDSLWGKRPFQFVPCVGPGYDDSSVRAWNVDNARDRGDHGEYYDKSWQAAINAVELLEHRSVGITSWNEWHEGSQIEPAIQFTSHSGNFNYPAYPYNNPSYYIDKTLEWVQKLSSK